MKCQVIKNYYYIFITVSIIKLKDLLIETKNVWKKPTYKSEDKAFDEAAEELDLDIAKIKKSFNNGAIKPLVKDVWSQLKNTDSTKTDTFHDLVQILQKYEKSDPEFKKDWKGIQNGFKKKSSMVAPIIMKHGKQYYMISGNTRLMVAKAMTIQPYVYLFIY